MKKLNVLAVTFLVFLSITINAAALEFKTIARRNNASVFGTGNLQAY